MSIVSPQTHNLSHSLLFIGAKREDANAFCKQLLGPGHAQKIDSGNHPDIHYYVPEGKSGQHLMATIQKMIQETFLPPFESPYKVFIIEEAEKMLPSSSNALLKTLEEPNPDAYFLLLSHHPDLLLPTILSRLQPLSFSREEMAPLGLSPYFSYAEKGEWDLLLDSISELEKEDPKAVLHGFLAYKKDSQNLEKLTQAIADAQKALDHNVRPRTVFLNLFLCLRPV